MKSKTSFFNITALCKNITRFAPAWAIYGLVLLLFVMVGSSDFGANYADDMAYTIPSMAVVNFFYALLCAQLLFGDLYNSRMCNALHALPMRREGWFFTNLTSGMLFSIVPNVLIALLSLLLVGDYYWQVPLLWLAAVTLQFVFFFGVAVLSAYLVGNRFAMALVYIIINGFSLIIFWLVYSIYEPMLFGITLSEYPFYTFCPVIKMASFEYAMLDRSQGIWGQLHIGDGWGYLGICAALGVVAMLLGLVCYSKRKLESAGDFVAIKPLGPVFLMLYTVCGGACCHGFFSLFVGRENMVFLLIGLAVGFFTGLMLLERRVKVFRKKTFLGFAGVILAMTLSLIVARFDMLGIVRWLPKADQVKNIWISTASSYNYRDYGITVTEPEQIRDLLSVHEHGLKNRDEGNNQRVDVKVFLRYTLTNGVVREREYYIDVDTEAGKLLKQYLCAPQLVLGEVYTMPDTYRMVQAEIADPGKLITDQKLLDTLVQAIIAYCEAGVLAADSSFMDTQEYINWIWMQFISPNGMHYYRDIMFDENCENVVKWVEQQGIQPEKYS